MIYQEIGGFSTIMQKNGTSCSKSYRRKRKSNKHKKLIPCWSCLCPAAPENPEHLLTKEKTSKKIIIIRNGPRCQRPGVVWAEKDPLWSCQRWQTGRNQHSGDDNDDAFVMILPRQRAQGQRMTWSADMRSYFPPELQHFKGEVRRFFFICSKFLLAQN